MMVRVCSILVAKPPESIESSFFSSSFFMKIP